MSECTVQAVGFGIYLAVDNMYSAKISKKEQPLGASY